MKNVFLSFAACLFAVSLLSCGNDNKSDEISTKVQELNSICPAYLSDDMTLYSVTYNEDNDYVKFTITYDEVWPSEIVNHYDQFSEYMAELMITEFSQMYGAAKAGQLDEGRTPLAKQVFPLIKTIAEEDSTSLKFTLIDRKSEKLNISSTNEEINEIVLID